MNLVKALNELHINLWGVLLILVGAGLCLAKHADIGATIITGGFAALNSVRQNGATDSSKPQ